MPFGLCNVSTTFQRLFMYIFTDLLLKSITVFVDDFSTQYSASTHSKCVRADLIRRKKLQLALNPDKTLLGVQREVLLEYVANEKGLEPDSNKIAVIDGLATQPMLGRWLSC